MHNCLQLDEIARAIVSYMARDSDKLHAAQTCKALYDIALDALWEDTPNVLLKLFACLPKRVVHINGDLTDAWNSIPSLTVKHVPMPQDWDRFLHHAKRVAVLNYWSVSCSRSAGPYYLDVLRDFFQDRPVLPNLKSFHMDTFHGRHAGLFLSARLEQISLTLEDLPYFRMTMAQLVDVRNSRIRSLRFLKSKMVAAWPVGWRISSVHVEQILAFPTVVSLVSHVPLDTGDVVKLAALPCLAELELEVQPLFSSRRRVGEYTIGAGSDSPFKQKKIGHTQTTCFPSLARFTYSNHVDDIVSVMRAVALPAIEALHLNIYWDAWETQATRTDASEVIVACLTDFKTLKELHLEMSPQATEALPASTLARLVSLSNLSVVCISGIPIAACPEDILAMARAWPRIRSLQLGTQEYSVKGLSVCIEDLLPLAEHCPLLQDVAVAVTRSDKLGRAPLAEPGLVVHTGLRWLCLFGSSVHGTVACSRVVTFMRTVFPNAVLQADGPVLDMMQEERAKAASGV